MKKLLALLLCLILAFGVIPTVFIGCNSDSNSYNNVDDDDDEDEKDDEEDEEDDDDDNDDGEKKNTSKDNADLEGDDPYNVQNSRPKPYPGASNDKEKPDEKAEVSEGIEVREEAEEAEEETFDEPYNVQNRVERPYPGTAQTVQQEKRLLKVAVNAEYPPFEYIEGNKLVGADIEIMQKICEYLDYDLEFHDLSFDSMLTGVAAGTYDAAISGIYPADDRKQNIDFSNDYYVNSLVVLVMEGSDIENISDLEYRTVACIEGTAGEYYVDEYTNIPFADEYDAILELKSGGCDAFVIERAIALELLSVYDDIRVLDEVLTEERYAIALDKGDDELRKNINTALKALRKNGTLQQIYDKYDLIVD